MTLDDAMTKGPLPAACIFDCDGTLLDSMGAWLDVQPRLLASFGVEGLTAEDFAEFESLSVEDECDAYHERWGAGSSGRELCDRLLSMLEDAYAREVPPMPGLVSFVRGLHAAGVPMAVATSTPEHLVRAGLAHAGIEGLFDNVTTTGMVSRSKDFPDVYDFALRRLAEGRGVPEPDHARVWVFEDAVFGLKSVGSAGYRRVGIFDPAGRFTADEVRANCEIFIEGYDEGLLDRIRAFER